MAKVSLIVPVYNTGKYLNKCIDSLLAQTLADIEILLINDGSKDNADEIIRTYKDKRIVYIKKDNEGIGKTRNLGIEKATGEYLAFVDSDDYLAKEFCEKMYNKAIKDHCDLVICDYFEDNHSLVGIKFTSFADTNLEETPDLLNNINLGPCNKLYKKDLFQNKANRFVENKKYEDAPFVVRMLLSAKKIGKVDDYLTYYVIHEQSETTIRDARIFDILDIVQYIIADLEKFDYMHEAMINVVVMILTDYTIQQRYIKSRKMRSRFIDEAFSILKKVDVNWRNCHYLQRFSKLKRKVKTSRLLTKIYCDFYARKL